jgi:predicted GIY-YIG superfamily endonuclease
MVDYKNSIVYKIISKNTDKIYIGSTTQNLKKRLSKHIYESKNPHDLKLQNVLFL